jgi:hypothetical protein
LRSSRHWVLLLLLIYRDGILGQADVELLSLLLLLIYRNDILGETHWVALLLFSLNGWIWHSSTLEYRKKCEVLQNYHFCLTGTPHGWWGVCCRWTFYKELLYHMFFPLTLPLLYLFEGGAFSIRNRMYWGSRTALSQWVLAICCK